MRALLAIAVVVISPALVHAQGSYPSRPITLVMPVAPGSSSEGETRAWTDRLSEGLGQPMVIEFKPGGGTVIALSHVAQARPDGYTLGTNNINMALIPLKFDNPPVDIKNFEYVSLLNKRVNYLIVGGQVPVNNLKEFVAYAKANPGALNFAANGEGSVDHIMGLWLMSATGIKGTFIHYKAASTQTADLLAGRSHVVLGSLVGSYTPLLKSGKLRAIGTAALSRGPQAPDLPTLQEQGIPEYEAPGFVGLIAPPKTPAAIINRLNAEISKAAKSPELQKRLGSAVLIVGSSPAEFRQAMEKFTSRFGSLAKEFNINMKEGG